MKQSSRLAKLKQQKQRRQTVSRSGNRQHGKLTLPRWAWVGLCLLLLAGGGTWAVFEFVIWNKVPPELVGTWDVQTGSLAGGTFEFSRGGALRMRHMKADVKWQVTVDGKALLMTTQNAPNKEERTQGGTIQELTPNSLVIELEKGEVLKMVRRK